MAPMSVVLGFLLLHMHCRY